MSLPRISNVGKAFRLYRPLARFLRSVPDHIMRPDYAASGEPGSPVRNIIIYNEEQVEQIREANQVARKLLEMTCDIAKEGKTTDEIDAEIHQATIDMGAYPAPLNYRHFPKSVAASVNDEICHGIPNDRPLQNGDIAKFDISVFYQGAFGDNCATVLVGDVSEEDRKLDQATRESLQAAIETIRPGSCLSEIGAAIHKVIDTYGFDSVEMFGGHGVGHQFHMPPFVVHRRNDFKLSLEPGMVFTIEPMIVRGSQECEISKTDGWTVRTKDGSRAAQYEHTIAVTKDGYSVLTKGQQDGNPIALNF